MADDKPEEGKRPSQALVTTPKSDGPAVRPAEEDEQETEALMTLAQREIDNPEYSAFRRRLRRHHLTMFGGSVVVADLVLRILMNGWWDYKTYLPLTISTVVAGILYKGSQRVSTWLHGRSERVIEVWKLSTDKQIVAFADRRIDQLNRLSKEVGRPEIGDRLAKLREALLTNLGTWRVSKRHVGQLAGRVRPPRLHGTDKRPAKHDQQLAELQGRLLKNEERIQTILHGFTTVEGALMLAASAEPNGDGAAEELDRLLSEIGAHGVLLKESAKEAEKPPPDPFEALEAQENKNAPDKK